ncbi:MAG TPA: serine/threonine-protein kinase [Ktedonobacterales bacterium]
MARGTSATGGLTGRTLGHYVLGPLLGTGGMAEVYRARDTRLRREVAVKVLPPTLAADPSYVTRFRSEAQRVAALRHANIVPVYEFGEQDGLLYLVMPLVPGSLRDSLLRSGTLRTADALAVAIQVASALEAAHAQGIVHRDVKPENILLDRDGHALLTDFGIARELAFLRRAGAVQTLAATGLPVGTPEYMAPEQLRNGPIDQRADVYALGAVLYELLCGVAPHEAGTPYEVAALALTEPIVPPSEHNPKIWPELDDVLLKALASDADERYPSVASFASALRTVSRRGMGLGAFAGVRATLPIFRKTAMVDPYEGPTDQIDVFEVVDPAATTLGHGLSGVASHRLPRRPRARGAKSKSRRTGLGRALPLAALALVVVIGSTAMLHAQGVLLASTPTPTLSSPTATATFIPTDTPSPTVTPSPTATPTLAPTPTPAPLGNTAQFIGMDTATQGTWRGHYGSLGYSIFQDSASIPSWITIAGSKTFPYSTYTWVGSTSDPRALQKVEDSNTRIAATWYTGSSYTLTITFSDDTTYHQVALYCLDWDSYGRGQTVQVFDARTNTELSMKQLDDSQQSPQLHNGVYLVWKVSGSITIKLTHTAGYNAVASGLFFD